MTPSAASIAAGMSFFPTSGKADDIEIHSFEDLGLDNDGIDFSSIPDADERHDAHHGNDVPRCIVKSSVRAEI